MIKFKVDQEVIMTKEEWRMNYCRAYDRSTLQSFFGVHDPRTPPRGYIREVVYGNRRFPSESYVTVMFNRTSSSNGNSLRVHPSKIILAALFIQREFSEVE